MGPARGPRRAHPVAGELARIALEGDMMRGELVTFTRQLTDEPPSEFRIFASGINPSRKGPAVFDARAAADVMQAYRAHGADIMLDLEHLSLNDEAPNFDPDARGWCKLELRGGELWAVDVRWTVDGAARIRAKKQRYISPAFYVDPKSRRVVEIKNVALTALPATDSLTPLVAARDGNGDRKMLNSALLALLGLAPDADEKAAADALAADPAKALAAISKAFDDGAAEEAAEGDAPAPVANSDSGAPPGAPVKKVTTEYHQNAGRPSAVENELALEVRSLSAKLAANEVRQLITANRRKLGTPALERWALTQTPEALAEFLAVQPEAAPAEQHREGARKTGAAIELTAEERALCKLTGRDPKVLLKFKQEQAAAAAEDR
jgi:phage I-like protein